MTDCFSLVYGVVGVDCSYFFYEEQKQKDGTLSDVYSIPQPKSKIVNQHIKKAGKNRFLILRIIRK